MRSTAAARLGTPINSHRRGRAISTSLVHVRATIRLTPRNGQLNFAGGHSVLGNLYSQRFRRPRVDDCGADEDWLARVAFDAEYCKPFPVVSVMEDSERRQFASGPDVICKRPIVNDCGLIEIL